MHVDKTLNDFMRVLNWLQIRWINGNKIIFHVQIHGMFKKRCSLVTQNGIWSQGGSETKSVLRLDSNREAVPGSVPEDYYNIYPHLVMTAYDYPGVITPKM